LDPDGQSTGGVCRLTNDLTLPEALLGSVARQHDGTGGLKGSAQHLGELTNVVELIEEDMDAEADVSRG
jgi:hypothetical protein